MKLAFITSTPYLEDFASLGTMDMALAPLCLNSDKQNFSNKYCDYFYKQAESGKFVLVDNGAYEKDLINEEILVEISHRIKPSCIVAPDVLKSSKDTIIKTFNFLDSKEYYGKLCKSTGIMAIPQGNDLFSYLESYRLFANDPRITHIGLTFQLDFNALNDINITQSTYATRRINLLKYLQDNNLVNANKPHHLLGLTTPLEISYAKKFEWVGSNDSSSPFIHGALGVAIDLKEGLVDLASGRIVEKSKIDIKDFEYGYLTENLRPNKPLKIHKEYKKLIKENINKMFEL